MFTFEEECRIITHINSLREKLDLDTVYYYGNCFSLTIEVGKHFTNCSKVRDDIFNYVCKHFAEIDYLYNTRIHEENNKVIINITKES